jgi:hypothetical protein
MFTQSRRVLKFVLAVLLLAVGPVQSLMKPALAATPSSILPTLGRPEADLKVLEFQKRATTTTTALPLPVLTLFLNPTSPLIASPSGSYNGPLGRYLTVTPSPSGSSINPAEYEVLCGGRTAPVAIDNGAVAPFERVACVAKRVGLQTVVVRDRLGRYAPRNLGWIASDPITVRAVAGQPVTFTLSNQPADLRRLTSLAGPNVWAQPARSPAILWWFHLPDNVRFSTGPISGRTRSGLELSSSMSCRRRPVRQPQHPLPCLVGPKSRRLLLGPLCRWVVERTCRAPVTGGW